MCEKALICESNKDLYVTSKFDVRKYHTFCDDLQNDIYHHSLNAKTVENDIKMDICNNNSSKQVLQTQLQQLQATQTHTQMQVISQHSDTCNQISSKIIKDKKQSLNMFVTPKNNNLRKITAVTVTTAVPTAAAAVTPVNCNNKNNNNEYRLQLSDDSSNDSKYLNMVDDTMYQNMNCNLHFKQSTTTNTTNTTNTTTATTAVTITTQTQTQTTQTQSQSQSQSQCMSSYDDITPQNSIGKSTINKNKNKDKKNNINVCHYFGGNVIIVGNQCDNDSLKKRDYFVQNTSMTNDDWNNDCWVILDETLL